MVKAKFITKEESDRLFQGFWPDFVNSIIMDFPTKTVHSKNIDRAPYFTSYVRQILLSRFGEDVVYNEGLSVYTTLDLKKQEMSRDILKKYLEKQNKISIKANADRVYSMNTGMVDTYDNLRLIFPLPALSIDKGSENAFKKLMVDEMVDSIDLLTIFGEEPGANQAVESFRSVLSGISLSTMNVEGATIMIEPSTGYIESMVGGSKFEVANQFNRAVQAKRQPGSAFKPFIYGAAIESKLVSTQTNLPDAPILDIDATGNTWAPGNYEGEFKGMVPLFNALTSSINVISVRLYDILGPDRIINYASKMTKVPVTRFGSNPTLSLGTSELTPFEMANAYAIFANKGRDVIPFAVRYVVDRDGNELANIEGEVGDIIAAKEMNGTIQVISEDVAWIMTHMMQGVIERGTAVEGIRIKGGYGKKAAGKTGTTSGWSDAWFCGFTPDTALIVWVGYDKPFLSLGRHQAGAAVAAPIWGRIMRELYKNRPSPIFPERPPGVYNIGGGYGLKGAHAQYYASSEEDKMTTVLERYMELEGMLKHREQLKAPWEREQGDKKKKNR
jgi:penicillin-binding protein 1A